MKKIKKIKIKVNGKFKSVTENYKISDLVKDLKIPLKKVAIELNQELSLIHISEPTRPY